MTDDTGVVLAASCTAARTGGCGDTHVDQSKVVLIDGELLRADVFLQSRGIGALKDKHNAGGEECARPHTHKSSFSPIHLGAETDCCSPLWHVIDGKMLADSFFGGLRWQWEQNY